MEAYAIKNFNILLKIKNFVSQKREVVIYMITALYVLSPKNIISDKLYYLYKYASAILTQYNFNALEAMKDISKDNSIGYVLAYAISIVSVAFTFILKSSVGALIRVYELLDANNAVIALLVLAGSILVTETVCLIVSFLETKGLFKKVALNTIYFPFSIIYLIVDLVQLARFVCRKAFFTEQKEQIHKARSLSSRKQNRYDCLKILDGMVGMKEFKKKMRDIVDFVYYIKSTGANNRLSLHMVFTGNPGTGKTEAARLLGKILKDLGYLSKGHFVEVQVADIIKGYVGQTEENMKRIISDAMGGILFIDEAYSLISSYDCGQQAINILLKYMEDCRNDFVVIAAGYKKEMEIFLNANTGLRSRFPYVIDFPDYTDGELKEIFFSIAKREGYKVQPEAVPQLEKRIKQIKSSQNFGNGRSMRNLFEETVMKIAQRVNEKREMIKTITEEDLKIEEPDIGTVDEELKTLDCLVGMKGIKEQLQKTIALVHYNIEKEKMGKNANPVRLHMVFMGNPGTGKTTVARLVGRIYKKLGLLSNGHVVEVDRSKLVGPYIGHTEMLTRQILDQAMGGILLIDEAYALFSESRIDFGQRAMEAIMKRMEDTRTNFMVIMTGYQDEMKRLLSSNPGIESRIGAKIYFNDFTDDELVEIFRMACKKGGDEVSEEAIEMLREILPELRNRPNFGNARDIERIYEQAIMNMSLRLMLKSNDKAIIMPQDIILPS